MVAKVLCFATFVAFAVAQHEHGHPVAHSSQHISRHDGHPHVVQVHVNHDHGHGSEHGHGHGSEHSHGHGHEHGHGHGHEHGHGHGHEHGLGHGPAHGHGHGHEHGHGHGHEHGLGHGPAHGHGHGHEHGHGHGHEHGSGHGYQHGHVDHNTHPHYEFEYRVEDHHTGDIKSQHESRNGDVVTGYYALHQPDGFERSVHYHGDHHTGFHANVNYGTHHLHPVHHH